MQTSSILAAAVLGQPSSQARRFSTRVVGATALFVLISMGVAFGGHQLVTQNAGASAPHVTSPASVDESPSIGGPGLVSIGGPGLV
jgi:hypothetical protein